MIDDRKNTRLSDAIAYCESLAAGLQPSTAHLFNSDTAASANVRKRELSDPAEPTVTVRLRRSTIDLVMTAWPTKKERICAINEALKSAAKSVIQSRQNQSHPIK